MTRSGLTANWLARHARIVVAIVLSIGVATSVSASALGGTPAGSAQESVPGSDSDAAEAELTTIVSPPSEFVPGTSFDLVIDIANVGTGTAENVTATIPMMDPSLLDVPGQLPVEVCEDIDGAQVCTSSSCGLAGGDLVCTFSICEFTSELVCTNASIGPGATVRAVAQLVVLPDYRSPTLPIAAAITTWTSAGGASSSSVSADPDDPVSAAEADLTISVAAPDTVQADATFDVVVLVEAEVGSAFAYDLVVTFPVPDGTTSVSIEGFGACSLAGPASDVIECRMEEFEPAGFADWAFSFAIPADEDRERLPLGPATVTASTPDPDETNNIDDPPDPSIDPPADTGVDDPIDPLATDLPATL